MFVCFVVQTFTLRASRYTSSKNAVPAMLVQLRCLALFCFLAKSVLLPLLAFTLGFVLLRQHNEETGIIGSRNVAPEPYGSTRTLTKQKWGFEWGRALTRVEC